jgi:hypothetical protein
VQRKDETEPTDDEMKEAKGICSCRIVNEDVDIHCPKHGDYRNELSTAIATALHAKNIEIQKAREELKAFALHVDKMN